MTVVVQTQVSSTDIVKMGAAVVASVGALCYYVHARTERKTIEMLIDEFDKKTEDLID